MAQAEHEQPVVGRGAGGAAERQQAATPPRLQHSPVVAQLRPHRPPEDESGRLHPEHLLQQAHLGAHVIDVADAPTLLRQAHGAVARAAGASVAELAHHHHAPTPRIKDRTHQPIDILRPEAVGGGHQYKVGAVGRRLAEHPVGQMGLLQLLAAGEAKAAQRKHRVAAGAAHGALAGG